MAMLRPGNVHIADGWDEALLFMPHAGQTVVVRADAAFAIPAPSALLAGLRTGSSAGSERAGPGLRLLPRSSSTPWQPPWLAPLSLPGPAVRRAVP